MKLTAIEGNRQRLDGGAMYGNAPRALWTTWSAPDEQNRIELACRALLVTLDDGRNLLFETGIGAFFEPKMRERFGVFESEHKLVENLKKQNVDCSDIDAVILSHLHFDHAGGSLTRYEDGEPQLVFPRAKFYVGKRHWERAKHPHSRDKASFIPTLNTLLENSGRLVLIDDSGTSDLAPLVRFRFSDGHTIGLMMAELALPSGPLVFCSDLIPGTPWVHIPISMGYDRFPELLSDEKRTLLGDLLATGGKLFFTHDPEDACGIVRRDEKGRFFAEPISLTNLVSPV